MKFFILGVVFVLQISYGFSKETPMELSEYVTIAFTVPETHADQIRQAMGAAGAGELGNYSYGSFSSKGIARFMPNQGANPFLGEEGILEEVMEERIETVCHKNKLEKVIDAIKKAHPYEETIIDIFPIYQMGLKRAKS